MGPLKGAMSSQKAPLGFENETMELLEKQKKIMFPDEVLQICPRGKPILIFFLVSLPNVRFLATSLDFTCFDEVV